nr:cbb3-type cytochrome c oxidase subunit I [uncultured Desulfobacter sp.]
MPEKMAKLFIITSLFFLLFCCIEGLMFPLKFALKSICSTLFHIPGDQIKAFFGYFVAKIHTHVGLIGWLSASLMGILYITVPKISGRQRYYAWAAWGNFGCHTAGVLILIIGFHMIGILGLTSGFAPGSEEFRAASDLGKQFVIAGGVLILISVLLFSLNMLRTLLVKGKRTTPAMTSNKPVQNKLAGATAFLAAGMILFNTAPGMASATQVPEKADVIIIGDRLVDIAYNLGVLPAAMSVRCSLWPLCDTLKNATQVLGCPNCLQKKKAKPLINFAKAHHIKRVIIEKGEPFCLLVPELHPEKTAGMLEGHGLSVTIVEYSHDLDKTVNRMAALLGKEDRAQALLDNYEKSLARTMKNIETKTFAKRVVILNGVFQASSGKSFLRVESPGGYADQFLLSVLKSTNVGNEMVTPGKKSSKGHYSIRKLDHLVTAAPDAIIVTGDGFAVQKALDRALVQNPNLAGVPAIKNQAVYNLPGFIQSSLIEYPSILAQWAFVLAR